MEIVEQSVEYWPADKYVKEIERAARVCYKSENAIGSQTAMPFVEMLKRNGHHAMLEHGTIHFAFRTESFYSDLMRPFLELYNNSPRMAITSNSGWNFVSISYRECYEYLLKLRREEEYKMPNGAPLHPGAADEFERFVESSQADQRAQLHSERIQLHIVTDRAIANELERHRVFSFAQESTRYCNYSKDKFGGQIKVVKPKYFEELSSFEQSCWFQAMEQAEERYLTGLKIGMKPQDARGMLPLSLKAELVMTGFRWQWDNMLQLRLDKAAHPMMRELAAMIKVKLDSIPLVDLSLPTLP